MADESTDVAPAASAVPGLPPDWAQQGTNKVIDLVDQVRTKTSGPAIKVSRGVVYGMVAGVLALFMLPIIIVMLIHLAGSLVAIWIVYLVLGAIFVLAGMLLWRKRPRGVAGT